MKTVGTNAWAMHMWLSPEVLGRDEARRYGRGASVSFDGDRFNSYGARIAVRLGRGGKGLVVFSGRYHSSTATRHKGGLRSATSHWPQVFLRQGKSIGEAGENDVLQPLFEGLVSDHDLTRKKALLAAAELLRLWRHERQEFASKLPRFTLGKHNERWLASVVRGGKELMGRELEYEAANDTSRARAFESATETAAQRSERQEAARERARGLEEQARKERRKNARAWVKAWRNHRPGDGTSIGNLGYNLSSLGFRTMLVVTGANRDVVRTSRGAEVPLRDALVLLKLWLRGQARAGERVGSYAVSACNGNSIQIGCHKIRLREAMKVLGGLLNKEQPQEAVTQQQ